MARETAQRTGNGAGRLDTTGVMSAAQVRQLQQMLAVNGTPNGNGAVDFQRQFDTARLDQATKVILLRGAKREALTPGVEKAIQAAQRAAIEVGKEEPAERRQVFVDGPTVITIIGDGFVTTEGAFAPAMHQIPKFRTEGRWLNKKTVPDGFTESEGQAKISVVTVVSEAGDKALYRVLRSGFTGKGRVEFAQSEGALDKAVAKPVDARYTPVHSRDGRVIAYNLDLGKPSSDEVKRGEATNQYVEAAKWSKTYTIVRAGAERVRIPGKKADGELTVYGVTVLEQLGLGAVEAKDKTAKTEKPVVAVDKLTARALKELTLKQAALVLRTPAIEDHAFSVVTLKPGIQGPSDLITPDAGQVSLIQRTAKIQAGVESSIKLGVADTATVIKSEDPTNTVLLLAHLGRLSADKTIDANYVLVRYRAELAKLVGQDADTSRNQHATALIDREIANPRGDKAVAELKAALIAQLAPQTAADKARVQRVDDGVRVILTGVRAAGTELSRQARRTAIAGLIALGYDKAHATQMVDLTIKPAQTRVEAPVTRERRGAKPPTEAGIKAAILGAFNPGMEVMDVAETMIALRKLISRVQGSDADDTARIQEELLGQLLLQRDARGPKTPGELTHYERVRSILSDGNGGLVSPDQAYAALKARGFTDADVIRASIAEVYGPARRTRRRVAPAADTA